MREIRKDCWKRFGADEKKLGLFYGLTTVSQKTERSFPVVFCVGAKHSSPTNEMH